MTDYRRAYLFDDCDSNLLGSWTQQDREKRFPAIVTLLSRILFPAGETNWELIAYLGEREYRLVPDAEEPAEIQCDWLKEETTFDRILSDILERNSNMRTLILIDWSMSSLKWGLEQGTGAKSAARILKKLDAHRAGLLGTVVCYTSAPGDNDFREGYKHYAELLSKGNRLSTMKLMWRWNDIESTLYTLKQALKKQKALDAQKGTAQ